MPYIAGRETEEEAQEIVKKLSALGFHARIEKIDGQSDNGCYDPCFHVHINSRNPSLLGRAFTIANT